jgi:hypothetical protein
VHTACHARLEVSADATGYCRTQCCYHHAKPHKGHHYSTQPNKHAIVSHRYQNACKPHAARTNLHHSCSFLVPCKPRAPCIQQQSVNSSNHSCHTGHHASLQGQDSTSQTILLVCWACTNGPCMALLSTWANLEGRGTHVIAPVACNMAIKHSCHAAAPQRLGAPHPNSAQSSTTEAGAELTDNTACKCKLHRMRPRQHLSQHIKASAAMQEREHESVRPSS